MIRTIQIDDSSRKGKALLEYLLTLDFVKEESDEFALTKEHKKILEERRSNRMSGKSKTFSWDEAKDSLGKKRIA